jgi:hypothetical protein
MLAIPGIVALVIFIYARPQEFFAYLRAVPLLYLFFGLALFGMLVDFRLRNLKLRMTPQLPWAFALFVYASVAVFIRAPAVAVSHVMGLAICMALYLVIAHGLQSFRAFNIVACSVLAMVVFVCGVGALQGFSETQCVEIDESTPGDSTVGNADGRPCETPRTCYEGDAEPGAEYMCEKIGLLGTTSVGRGRVRYRGVLQDPNELALAGAVGLPLAFGFGQVRRRSLPRWLVAVLTLALVVLCAVLTRSRGGQLVFLAVLAAYFARRFGVTGLAIGGVLAAPLLLLGGRSGAEADSSTSERLDCWAEALSMWRSHPILGVGLGQFNEYHYKTAHNSYLLTLAELGFPGMVLFSIVVYLSAKIPFVVLSRTDGNDEAARPARAWAMALLAAFAGLTVGIFFLSFAYHYVLWIYIGLAGALYSAVRRHDPSIRVSMGVWDIAIVAGTNLLMIATIYLYTRWALA